LFVRACVREFAAADLYFIMSGLHTTQQPMI